MIKTGDFSEALEKTFKAKSLFTHDSLRTRMTHLLRASLSAGVTSLTTHIEADPFLSPPSLSLDVALELKREWADRITIRIVVFAQERCFVRGEEGDERRRSFEEACKRKGVDACGSAPYVEKREEGEEEMGDPTGGRGQKNARWVFEVAKKNGLDVDCEFLFRC
jgi:cytosine/adenosine deaminase-related metal-dependent hydrolase